MTLMRKQNRQGARYKDGSSRRQKAASIENGGLIEHFFGSNGKACLRHERFAEFLRDLHNEVCNLSLSASLNFQKEKWSIWCFLVL